MKPLSNSRIFIRPVKKSDLSELQALFVETITSICKSDYSAEQIDAWTGSVKNTQRWVDKLSSQYFLVAQLDNKIAGFASLEGADYLDFLYVHKDHQGQGIATRLYLAIEEEAEKKGAAFLHSDVSITARSFFESRGFKILQPQSHKIGNVEINNYKMAKDAPFR